MTASLALLLAAVTFVAAEGPAPKFARSPCRQLYEAASRSLSEFEKARAETGAAVDCEDDMTPLLAAAQVGKVDVVKAILREKDVDLNRQHKSTKTTPLIAAIQSESPETVAALLADPRTDVNVGEPLYGYPVSLAARLKDGAILGLLLAKPGIDVNVKSSGGSTPLIYAARHGSLEAVKKLLAYPGVQLDVRDSDFTSPVGDPDAFPSRQMERRLPGGTALDWALRNHHEDIAAALRAAGARSTPEPRASGSDSYSPRFFRQD